MIGLRTRPLRAIANICAIAATAATTQCALAAIVTKAIPQAALDAAANQDRKHER